MSGPRHNPAHVIVASTRRSCRASRSARLSPRLVVAAPTIRIGVELPDDASRSGGSGQDHPRTETRLRPDRMNWAVAITRPQAPCTLAERFALTAVNALRCFRVLHKAHPECPGVAYVWCAFTRFAGRRWRNATACRPGMSRQYPERRRTGRNRCTTRYSPARRHAQLFRLVRQRLAKIETFWRPTTGFHRLR
jgi:hypothetical protein